MSGEVGVVAGVAVVIAERMIQVLVAHSGASLFWHPGVVGHVEKPSREALEGQLML